MRILVIGGTRFIGAAAVRSLHGMGHEVTVFYRGREPHTQADLPAGVVHVRGDRRRIAEHAADLRRLAPDVVLDMVAMTERDAHDLVAALDGTVPRLVAISSQDVYRAHGRLIGREPGPPDPVPLDEEAPLRERLYPYRGETPRPADDPRQWIDDYDKILVERVVMGTPDLQGTVLRLPMVYGPGDGQHRLFEHLKRMDNHARRSCWVRRRRAGAGRAAIWRTWRRPSRWR